MTVPVIRPLPPAPVRADAPADFSAKADAFVAALPGFGSDMNALGAYVDSQIVAAETSAQAAAYEAFLAQAAVGAAQAQALIATQKAEEAGSHTEEVEALKESAEAAAAAAQAAAGLPAIAGQARRVLRVTEDAAGVQWGGPVQINGLVDDTVTVAAATGTITLDVSQAGVFDLTLSGNVTLAVAGTLTGGTTAIVVRIRQGSPARTVTWWGGVTWLTGTGVAPTAPAANKIREYVMSFDGTAWIGREGAGN